MTNVDVLFLDQWVLQTADTGSVVVSLAEDVMGVGATQELITGVQEGRLGERFVYDLWETAVRTLPFEAPGATVREVIAQRERPENARGLVRGLIGTHYLATRLHMRDDPLFWQTVQNITEFVVSRNRPCRECPQYAQLLSYVNNVYAERRRPQQPINRANSLRPVAPIGRPAPQPVSEPIDSWYRDRTTPENPRPLPPAPRTDEALTEVGRRRPARGVTNGRSRANATQPPIEAAFGSRRTAPQQQPAARGPQANLNFESGTHWQCADTAGQVRQYLFSEMEDSHLYYTLEFLIDNTASLYRQYYRDGQNLDPIARTSGTTVHEYWLKTRAAFGGLLREALRRGLTFPPNMVAFLTKNFAAGSPVRVATPWRSGAVQQEVQNLRSNVENYYTDQTAQNAGERTGRYMS